MTNSRWLPPLSWIALAAWIGLAMQLRDVGAQDAPPSRGRIEEALRRYRHEPTVDALVREALAQDTLDPSRARDAVERARLSGLLPQARGTIQRGQALDSSERQSGTFVSSDDELTFGASLTFRLDRLLYASEEASLLRERRHLEERRLALVSQLVHVFFERRRLQLERDLSGGTDIELEMRVAEAEALLDVFTAGAFSRMMGDAAPEDGMEPDRSAPPDRGDE